MAYSLLTAPPTFFDLEECEEEEEEETGTGAETEEVCPSCGDCIDYEEDIYLIKLCWVREIEGRWSIEPIRDDEEGDYYFEVFFLHSECWDDIAQEIRDETSDVPPILHPEEVLNCGICGSSILPIEFFCTITPGRIQGSARVPNNQYAAQFVEGIDPGVVCLSCLARCNEDIWETSELSQFGECVDCIHARCWRTEHCTCTCHKETP